MVVGQHERHARSAAPRRHHHGWKRPLGAGPGRGTDQRPPGGRQVGQGDRARGAGDRDPLPDPVRLQRAELGPTAGRGGGPDGAPLQVRAGGARRDHGQRDPADRYRGAEPPALLRPRAPLLADEGVGDQRRDDPLSGAELRWAGRDPPCHPGVGGGGTRRSHRRRRDQRGHLRGPSLHQRIASGGPDGPSRSTAIGNVASG
jgi:hypothetical protein